MVTRRRAANAFLDYLDSLIGVGFGWDDWESIRFHLEKQRGEKLPDTRASRERALQTAGRLSRTLKLTVTQDEQLRALAQGISVSTSTLICLDYIAAYGPVPIINAVRLLEGMTLRKDPFDRYQSCDGNWTIAKNPDGTWSAKAKAGEPGKTGGLTECQTFVKQQPVKPFQGSRRINRRDGILTITCPYGHINHYAETPRFLPAYCPTCDIPMGDVGLVEHSAEALFPGDGADRLFED